jgi:short-subunit dehydrogenase
MLALHTESLKLAMGNHSQKLKDRVVIVTGASMGIGRETALLFAQHGAKVTLAARSHRLLEEVSSEIARIGSEALVTAADITKRAEVDEMVAATMQKWGRIDILINNAGYGVLGPLVETPEDELRRLFDVNVFGSINCIQAVYPQMKKQQRGQIINVSSIVGLRSIPTVTAYSMTKFALNALSDGLRVEAKSDHIQVLSIYPGSTESQFHKNQKIIGNRPQHPKWFAKSAAQVASSILDASLKGRRDTVLTWSARGMALVNFFAPGMMDRILHSGFRKYDSK